MAEEPNSVPSSPTSSSSSPPSPPTADDRPQASSSGNPSTYSEGRDDEEEEHVDNIEEEDGEEETHDLISRPPRILNRPDYSWQRQWRPTDTLEEEETVSVLIRGDTWSCIIVFLTFWFFVSLTLILGIYGSETIELSPYSSILLQPNPWLVQYVKVEKSDGRKSAAVLYGMYKAPFLNDTKAWSESVNASIETDSHKEWVFFLNKGSQFNITYNVPSSSSLLLIIAQGEEEMAEWLEDPSYPDTTLSWNVIYGSGLIKQDISKSSYYYVAIKNLNTENIEAQLKLQVRSSAYDTTDAYYKCSVNQALCSLEVRFPKGNSAVLTSPDLQEGEHREELYVELSYEPRWITYFVGIGGMTLLMLSAFGYLHKMQSHDEDRIRVQAVSFESERAPLLSPKDDDIASWGSSYDSDPNTDEENLEDLEARLYDGKAIGDGQSSNTVRQLCLICFDAPRDCFFLPCGHCAACFTCATRIAEEAGTCPICRRTMKKIRKIYSV